MDRTGWEHRAALHCDYFTGSTLLVSLWHSYGDKFISKPYELLDVEDHDSEWSYKVHPRCEC